MVKNARYATVCLFLNRRNVTLPIHSSTKGSAVSKSKYMSEALRPLALRRALDRVLVVPAAGGLPLRRRLRRDVARVCVAVDDARLTSGEPRPRRPAIEQRPQAASLRIVHRHS